MEKLQWFKFSPSDYIMGKIQRCPEITQARFIRLCCLYWNKECSISVSDSIIEIDKEHFDILVSKNIIKINNEFVSIDFLNEQLDEITQISKGKSKAAKARWARHNEKKNNTDAMQNDANAMHVHTDAMQNDAEKRREEKRREKNNIEADKIDFDALLTFINETFGRNFKTMSNQVKAKYKARLKDGYNKLDFKTAMVNCSRLQFHKDNNFQYCTPEYFSRSEILDKYSDITKQQEEKIYDPLVDAMNAELVRSKNSNQ